MGVHYYISASIFPYFRVDAVTEQVSPSNATRTHLNQPKKSGALPGEEHGWRGLFPNLVEEYDVRLIRVDNHVRMRISARLC